MHSNPEGAVLRLRLAKDSMDLAVVAAEKCDFVRVTARIGEAYAMVAESKTLVGPETHERLAKETWGVDIPKVSVEWTKTLLKTVQNRCGCSFKTSSRRFM